jgi:hypothetical protein
MSQATPIIGANKSGLDYRQDDNDGKQALLTHHKGAAAPDYAEAGILWLDDSATPWQMKLYDGADWITLGAIAPGTNMFTPYCGQTPLRTLNHAADTGAANAYATAPQPVIAAYAAGQIVTLCPLHGNTGASTLAVSGLSARDIKLAGGADIPAGAMLADGLYLLVYDGADFILLNPETAGGGAALATPALSQLVIRNNAAVPGSKVDITAAAAILTKPDGTPVFDSGISLTLDFSAAGAGGLDAGSMAGSSFYHLWLVSDGTTTAALASLSATAPALPDGYAYKTRIGAVLTDSGGTLFRTRQAGNRCHYTVTAATNTNAMPLICSGSMGSTGGTYVAVSVSGVVPDTATGILLSVKTKGIGEPGGALLAPASGYGAYNSTANPPVACTGTYYDATELVSLPLESSNIYMATVTHTYVFCHGWVDAVNAT